MNGHCHTAIGLQTMAVLMVAHNRRDKTLQCLANLFANEEQGGVVLSVILVDDGSCDGTAEAVAAAYPAVEIIFGDGSLYWNRGMHRAFARALKRTYDYYLWLNDDTSLFADAIPRLLEAACAAGSDKTAIVVGSTIDPVTGKVTYGGERRVSWWRRLTFVKIQPSIGPQLCDSMNGNIVLVSRAAAALVGNLDPAFEHALGDNDYAMRAHKKGVAVWVAPGIFGTCSHNALTGTFQDRSLPLRKRWSLMMGRKGIPWRSWLVFTRRHTGIAWPLFFVWPYLKLVVSASLRRG